MMQLAYDPDDTPADRIDKAIAAGLVPEVLSFDQCVQLVEWARSTSDTVPPLDDAGTVQ